MDLTRFLKEEIVDTVPEIKVQEPSEEINEKTKSNYLDIPSYKLTPGMQQFVEVKKQHPDCLVLFRMGDFYETFYDDAETVSRELEIVLTARGAGEKRAPLAGVPYHALEQNLSRLIKRGYKVAIVEQLEDPKKAKGLVKRGVVRIVTPGTVMENALLEEKSNNYIMSLHVHGEKLWFALCDISTGEFIASESDTNTLPHALARFTPAECVIPLSLAVNKDLLEQLKPVFVNPIDDRYFRHEAALGALTSHFNTLTMDGFGIGEGVPAAGALLQYIAETQKTNLSYINRIKVENTSNFMLLDASTMRNLELMKSIRNDTKGTLLSVIDRTSTSMGSRLLRKWLKEPLLHVDQINKRLDAVEWLKNTSLKRNEIVVQLQQIQDIERLISRVNYGNANARDLLALSKSLEKVPALKGLLHDASSELLVSVKNMPAADDVVQLVQCAILDEPAVMLREGNMIKRGYHEELDKLHDIKKNSKRIISAMEEKEKEKTGIKTLRIRFNNVFGYYIEVSRSYLSKVPESYIRKQTTANSERYVTQELKEQEELIVNAEEKINALEYDLFQEIIGKIAQHTVHIQEVSRHVAQLDVLVSFARCAVQYHYTRPVVDDGHEITLIGSRHPVVEQLEDFVVNDFYVQKNEMMIITGPNMAGKSVSMRQVALIVLMAQMGSFVPCESAAIGVVDRIFTRVGASDDLATGQSTFMVEMSETANILHNATERSLIILDEIGRGTSTYDGVSIAWSVAEYIAHTIKAKTLFATHYHVLNKLAETHNNIQNYNIAVKEDGHDIIFLHKLLKGSTDKSYGVHVARLAGMPDEVITRAMEVQRKLEEDRMERVHHV